MVICLERGADLYMAQLMPLPLSVCFFSKIQIGLTFLVPAHPGSPGKRAFKWVCVCVCCGLDDRKGILLRPPPPGLLQVSQRFAFGEPSLTWFSSGKLGCLDKYLKLVLYLPVYHFQLLLKYQYTVFPYSSIWNISVGLLSQWYILRLLAVVIRYGDNVDNTVEENFSVFSLIWRHWLPSARSGSKTLHRQNLQFLTRGTS